MTNNLKSVLFTALIASIAVVGCGDSTNDSTTETSDSMSVNGDAAGNDMMNDRDDDAEFLSDAVEANAKELRALRLGKEKGGNEVKSDANKMLADHEKLGEDVAAYISNKSITLQDVDTADTDNDLNDKAAGRDFDKAWADKMVNDHEKVINMFEDAQDDVRDPELKTMITNAIPKLRSHLDMSKQLKEKLDKAN